MGPSRGAGLPTLGLLMVVVACGGDFESGDTDGGPPFRDGVVTLEIGQLDGPLEYLLGRVSGVAMDGAGRIYVADLQAHTVRVYGADGAYLRSIGTQGQGPGELVQPCCLDIAAGRLWVRDNGNHRLSAYRLEDDSAVFEVSRPMAHNSFGLWTPTFADGDVVYDVGTVVGSPSTRTLFAVGTDDRPTVVANVPSMDPEEFGGGRWIDVASGDGVARYFYEVPFGPRQLIAFGPGAVVAHAISSTYDVASWSPGADTLRMGDGRTEGPPLAEAELALGEERLAQSRERARSQGGSFDMDLPTQKPPLGDIYFDRDGRLWVGLSVAQGAPREADVYDATGTLVERRRWPSGVRLANPGWIRDDVALGLTVDSLGVQRVARVEWSGFADGGA